jgi:hypothetical protein
MTSASAASEKTVAEPERLRREPVEDWTRPRVSVVPDDVYVPTPISQSFPSSMM